MESMNRTVKEKDLEISKLRKELETTKRSKEIRVDNVDSLASSLLVNT